MTSFFFPSDNSLSDGKHACPIDPSDPSDNLTFIRLPQSPSKPLPHIPNWIKPCLSWRHFFSHRITLCPTENTLVRWIHRLHRTIWLSIGCHNHQASRFHTSLIELNPACHDVILSPSDNSLSDGKHACPMDPSDPSDNLTFIRLPQSPSKPLPHIPNWIKPCLSWRHFFFHRITLCPTENTLVRWIHRIHRTIWLSIGCHNHQASRFHTSLIELDRACHDVIFSPSDNSLSDGKHACPMDPSDPSDNLTLPQSPSKPLEHIPNWIKPCLSWRHFFSIG